MKNKLFLMILSASIAFATAACGTESQNSTDDTSLLTEIEGTNTENSILETEITEFIESADTNSDADASETGSDGAEDETATETIKTTEIPDATEAIESTEPVDATETSDSEKTSDDNEEIQDISEITVEDEDDGILLLKAYFGTEDSETGNKYVFIYLNTVTVNDVDYYAYTWSWAVDDHYSRLTDVFVSLDGKAIYQGDYDSEECIFNTDNMLDGEP